MSDESRLWGQYSNAIDVIEKCGELTSGSIQREVDAIKNYVNYLEHANKKLGEVESKLREILRNIDI